jgi:chromosome segregation ATPase
MPDFDKTMTNAQFNVYYPTKQNELSAYDTAYNKEINTVNQQKTPVIANINDANNKINLTNNNINNLDQQKNALVNNRVATENRRNDFQRRANSGNFITRRFYRARYNPLINQLNGQVNNINSQISQVQQQINTVEATRPGLNATRDRENAVKSQLESNEGELKTKIGQNAEKKVTLIQQSEYYNNRQKACNDAKTLIGNQKKRLKQYEDELAELNKQYEKCNVDYENKCSESQRNKLTKLIADRDTSQKLLDNNQTLYKKDCEGNIPDCGQLYSKFQRKQERYNVEKDIKNKLNREYKTCMDQTKNDCKDIYSAANANKSTTEFNIDSVKRNEGFTQYSSNDTADATHAKVVSNYKSVQRDYTKLKQNIKELNNANNNDNSKTSKYATKKQLYDNAIYTNILLTALATSMLYYVFIEI